MGASHSRNIQFLRPAGLLTGSVVNTLSGLQKPGQGVESSRNFHCRDYKVQELNLPIHVSKFVLDNHAFVRAADIGKC